MEDVKIYKESIELACRIYAIQFSLPRLHRYELGTVMYKLCILFASLIRSSYKFKNANRYKCLIKARMLFEDIWTSLEICTNLNLLHPLNFKLDELKNPRYPKCGTLDKLIERIYELFNSIDVQLSNWTKSSEKYIL